MKFLLCLVLCVAAAQASHVVRAGLTYSAPYSTYSVRAPLAYSAHVGFPTVYAAKLAAPTVYSGGLSVGGHLVRSTYAAPIAYSGSKVYTTLLK